MQLHPSPSHLESVTRYLSWDHDRLDGILAEATQRVEAGSLSEARFFFDAFDHGLRRHIHIEESILFPLFEARTGATRGVTETLRREHEIIARELGRMRMAMETGDAAEYATGLAGLADILGTHRTKEEDVLYPAMDDLLHDPPERNRLVDRLVRG